MTKNRLRKHTKHISIFPQQCGLIKALALTLCLTAPVSQAAVIHVTTSSDTELQQCRLRDAIRAANENKVIEQCAAGTENDVISMSGLTDAQITLSTPLPDITSKLQIFGSNANQSKVTIHADEQSYIFQVVASELNLRDLTLTGGGGSDVYDSAVRSIESNLQLFNTTISGNMATGIVVVYGTLEMFQSVVSNNFRGVFLDGASAFITDSQVHNNLSHGITYNRLLHPVLLTLSDCSISDNGGVGLVIGDANAEISRCTFSGNQEAVNIWGYPNTAEVTIRDSTVAHSAAGGIGVEFTNLTIENSTISSNTGHALFVRRNSKVELRHTTVSDTTVGAGQAAINFTSTQGHPEEVTLSNSLVANTYGGNDCVRADDSQKLILQGNNLVESVGNCVFSGSGSVIEGVDPLLGALSDNGGPTLTHMPSDISVVRDSGHNGFLPASSKDQRGTGFDRVFNGGIVDIGAVEIQNGGFAGPDYLVNTLNDSRDGVCELAPGDCSLFEAIERANSDPDASSVNFAGALIIAPGTITLGGTQLPVITTDISIAGSGMEVDADGASRVISVDGGDLDVSNMIWTNGSATEGGVISVKNGSFRLDGQSLVSGGSAEDGGAIFASNAVVNVIDSTISGNTASFRGGAISAFDNSTLAVVNSTVSGNSGGFGGAFLLNEGATLNLNQSTVAANTTTDNAAVFLQATATANISNSMIADSSPYDCIALAGSQVTFSGGNLIEFDNPSIGCASGNVIEADPMLGDLVGYGLARGVHLPANQSPVINAGDNAFVVGDLDQGGDTRILDAVVDIGAIETGILIFEGGFEVPE